MEHVAEQIEDLGKRDRREVISRLDVIVTYLVKQRFYPPDHLAGDIDAAIKKERSTIQLVLRDSPSLERYAKSCLQREVYRHAVETAALETGLAPSEFPEENPFPWDEIVGDLSLNGRSAAERVAMSAAATAAHQLSFV